MKNDIKIEPAIQLEILDLICEGWGSEDIATYLNLSTEAVLDAQG